VKFLFTEAKKFAIDSDALAVGCRTCHGRLDGGKRVFHHAKSRWQNFLTTESQNAEGFRVATGGIAKARYAAAMKDLPHTRGCFVCGEANKHGLNLRLKTNGQTVQMRFVPKPEHVGFHNTLHGGITATVLDEIMVWAVGVNTKRLAYCAEMNVRYLRPAHPGEELTVVGELVENRRDRIFEAKGELRNAAGEVLATSTGKYLPIKGAELNAMTKDFVGDTSEIFKL
jgi:uncharacterized protein (TIGR00369 family)